MSSIRKVLGFGATGAGLGVVFALALSPASALAAGHARPESVAVQSVALTATSPSAACTAARNALTKANTDDRAVDAEEKKSATPATAAKADVNEDKNEKAALKTLQNNVHAACTTPACLASEKSLKGAQTQDPTEGKSEKTKSTEKSTSDQAEDKLESAALKKLKDARHAACASSSK